MRNLTLGYLTLNASPLDTVRAAAAAEFQSVGLRITPRRINDPRPAELEFSRLIDEVRPELDRSGTRLASVAGFHLYPEVELAHLEQMVDAAADLGADYILTMSYQPDQAKFENLFSRYCECAAKRGLMIALEFAPYSEVKTIKQAGQLLDRLRLSNARLVIDALHLFRSGGTVQQVHDDISHNHILCLQLSDATNVSTNMTEEELVSEARYSRLAPGEGVLPLKDLLSSLPPEIEVEFEVPVPADGKQSIEERAISANKKLTRFLREVDEISEL